MTRLHILESHYFSMSHWGQFDLDHWWWLSSPARSSLDHLVVNALWAFLNTKILIAYRKLWKPSPVSTSKALSYILLLISRHSHDRGTLRDHWTILKSSAIQCSPQNLHVEPDSTCLFNICLMTNQEIRHWDDIESSVYSHTWKNYADLALRPGKRMRRTKGQTTDLGMREVFPS